MKIAFSKHAAERIKARGITKEMVLFVLESSDSVISKTNCKNVYQKVINEGDSKYLYRVFINSCKTPDLVITAYKTSKIDKYEY